MGTKRAKRVIVSYLSRVFHKIHFDTNLFSIDDEEFICEIGKRVVYAQEKGGHLGTERAKKLIVETLQKEIGKPYFYTPCSIHNENFICEIGEGIYEGVLASKDQTEEERALWEWRFDLYS